MCGRLLIVEDEVILRKHLVRVFVREGYDVSTAGSRAEALGELARSRFETLLLDVKLPDGDGLELLAELADCQRPRRTVVMTAFSTPENEERAQQLNVRCMLRKPVDLTELVGAVRGDARPLES